jgi:hypothetical protein
VGSPTTKESAVCFDNCFESSYLSRGTSMRVGALQDCPKFRNAPGATSSATYCFPTIERLLRDPCLADQVRHREPLPRPVSGLPRSVPPKIAFVSRQVSSSWRSKFQLEQLIRFWLATYFSLRRPSAFVGPHLHNICQEPLSDPCRYAKYIFS